jgi:hypothetical protein
MCIRDRYQINPTQLTDRFKVRQPVTLIDVSEPSEFAAGHLESVQNIPLRNLRQSLPTPAHLKNAEIIYIFVALVCVAVQQPSCYKKMVLLSAQLIRWNARIERKN